MFAWPTKTNTLEVNGVMTGPFVLSYQPIFELQTPVIHIGIVGSQCHYCGNTLEASTKQCPGCGARDWQKDAHRK